MFNGTVVSAGALDITNVTGQACTVASSLDRNRATLVSANTNETYTLAESVHPSGIMQRVLGNAVISLLEPPLSIAIASAAPLSRLGITKRADRNYVSFAMAVGGRRAEPLSVRRCRIDCSYAPSFGLPNARKSRQFGVGSCSR